MRIALGLEYDGRQFCGWQSQPSACGVQDALERALSKMAAHAVRVIAAGRTDTGVHATSQVVHFDTTTSRPISAWVRGINANLPDTLRVVWAQEVDEQFHARFDAIRRSYQYWLVNQAVAPAIMSGKAGWFHQPLDEQAMSVAMQYLIGEHDFSAFRAAECQAKSPIRTLYTANLQKIGDNVLFNFIGNAFLHHQVRNMVGALVYIGKGNYPPEFIKELLLCKDRTKAPPTFPPDGLYLVSVEYDNKWGLPNQARKLNLV